jgi:cobalt/nickel transport system ATP-binding protein
MLKVEGVSHSYLDGEMVLNNLSFEIPEGDKVVLLGTNGSGKTTLLKIMNGLIIPSEGRYTYKNTLVTKQALRETSFTKIFRREIVFLFQNPDAMLFNPTVYDEIAFGCKQLNTESLDEKVEYWANVFGLTRYLKRPPFQLSRGEKQKVCLASLLAVEPRLLLLDEPIANLDPRSTGWLVDFLHDLDITQIITTHNLSLAAELGERTLLLSENHELIYDGEIDVLLNDRDKLIEANLVHIHRHRHGDLEHRHYHFHEWD